MLPETHNSSGDLKIYINGELDTQSLGFSNGTLFDSATGAVIGRGRGTGRSWDGQIDDVRFYDRELTADEIAEIYAARDGIRYNESHRTPEFFDGNKFISLRPPFPEVDEGPIYDCPNIGDVCADGTVFAGLSPDGNSPIYTTAADQSSSIAWSSVSVDNGALVDDFDSGITNQVEADANLTLADYPVFQTCGNLTDHGYTDWFPPARNELAVLYTNRTAIGGFSTDRYWSSTEQSAANAMVVDFSNGLNFNRPKTELRDLRCIRKDSLKILTTAGLVGHWKLDETSGTTAADSSGNGNDGTMNSGLDATSDSGKGAVGNALRFLSNYGAISIPDDATLNPSNQITVSSWIKTTNASTSRMLYKWDGGSNNDYILWKTGAGIPRFEINTSGGSVILSATAVDINDGIWHHITGTYDGSTVSIYVDGVFNNSIAHSGTLNDGTRPIVVGAENTTGATFSVNGQLDDVRIYDRAITDAEVTALYNMGTPIGSSTALPQGCPSVGDICDDGTYYVGLSPDGSVAMFAAPEDADDPNAPLAYNHDGSGNNLIGVNSTVTGEANTNTLATTDMGTAAGFQTAEAATYCYNLVTNHADDWYLPARDELLLLYNSGNHLANVSTGAQYWSSSERSGVADQAQTITMSNGNTNNRNKNVNIQVRCVRKGPAPRCANPYGLEGQMIYNSTHDVVQYCDGARWIGLGKDN